MCVICVVQDVRPNEEMIEKMWDANDDWGGVGYREQDERGDTYVHWKKGLELPEMKKLMAEMPLPYVAHFRVASQGGKRKELNHPFPIERSMSQELEGRTRGHILFHNGDWTGWKPMCLEAATRSKSPVPLGKWSDSRAMAFLASVYGLGVLEFLEQKIVVLGPNDLEILSGPNFHNNGWKKVEGVWCSNDFFTYRGRQNGRATTVYKSCREMRCNKTALIDKDYCADHLPAVPVVGAPGGTPSGAPFGVTTAKQQQPINLVEAEQLMLDRKMSRQQFKRIRKLYQRLNLAPQVRLVV